MGAAAKVSAATFREAEAASASSPAAPLDPAAALLASLASSSRQILSNSSSLRWLAGRNSVGRVLGGVVGQRSSVMRR
eukprot:3354358-Pleurochrysis_carterae.AAC.1